MAQKEETGDRNVMLDASASAKPREIPIGLPGDSGGTFIFEDGMPLASTWSPIYPYVHWAGSASYEAVGLMRMEETVLRSGVLGFAVDSHSRLGTDELHGTVIAKTNNDGLINVDANLNGRLARGWYFTAGVYANLDPTSVHPKHVTFVNNTQIYKVGLTHRWNQKELSLNYKLTANRDGLFGSDRAPFIYNGDGSISKLNGFRLGRDSYMPEDDVISYMDVSDGTMHTEHTAKLNRRIIHDLTLSFTTPLRNHWDFDARLHLTGTKNMMMMGYSESGIDSINGGRNAKGQSITRTDGSSYSGLMQRRMVMPQKFDFFETLAKAELHHKVQGHETSLGANYWFTYSYCEAASIYWAQTVEDDPQRLMVSNMREWDYNSVANYGRGREHHLGVFAIDDWNVTKWLNLYYGLRTELFMSDYRLAVNEEEGQTNNKRRPGFYIDDPSVSLSTHKRTKVNLTGLLQANFRLAQGLFASGEYLHTRQQRRFDQYRYDTLPTEEPYVKQLIRGGLIYDNSWLRSSLMISYINSRNISSTLYFTKQIGGVSETQGKNTLYNIGTLGITADATATFGGFQMHALLTYQEPKYRDFSVNLKFTDGSSETIDYSNKYVTGMSKWLFELDPSYRWNKWRVWLSARYYSRQFASMVNNVYFNGHWETFAGLDWQTTKRLSLSLSITNLLNQSGAKGSIDAANTITDNSLLNGYFTAGNFRRKK